MKKFEVKCQKNSQW